MGSKATPVTIGEVAKIKHGFAFKGEFFTEVAQPTILVTPGNFAVGGGFQPGKQKFYAGPVPEDYVLEAGDLVVTMTDLSKASDTLGYAARIPQVPEVTYLHNQRIGLVQMLDETRVRKDWLHYLMRTDRYRAWVIGSASGTTVKHTSPSRIESYSFIAPPLHEQAEAARLLDALDDRIDNFRQTNATLEAIAQALFKSWFVDFDPVRAKAAGREPEGMDAATAALFPSGFDDTREGSLPSGWQPIRYGDVALLSKGTVKPQEAPSTEFQHYSLAAFDAHKLPMVELGETIKSGKTPVPSGAVLVSKLNPHIPRIWFVGDVAENSVCSTEFLVWTPRANAGSAFLFCLAASQVFNSAMCQLVTGTSNSHQRVKPDQLANVEVIAASDEAISAFETIAAPLLAKVHYNRQRAATLAQLRDTLLPRLISGKLRLPEAEREIETATA